MLTGPPAVHAPPPAHAGPVLIEPASAQGYRLRIAPDRVELAADSAAGLRHARQTLAQLQRRFAGHASVPAMVIDDAPAFATRGFMLDVSRTRIPSMGELRRLVDVLESLKFNHLQLYTEHTFAYSFGREVWEGWSPLTSAEVRELDGWCAAAGIELAANQNCFGHLRNWLEHPKFAPLAETHGEWMFDVWPRRGPFSLCPTDHASETFVAAMLDELLPCFTSPRVNIGCDETYDVGWGRSKEAVAARGRTAVYLDFVERVCALVQRRGAQPMFWADIALHEPACVARIPAQLTALAWGYEPDSPFEEWGRLLQEAGRAHWVCPGTSCWRSITGRSAERRGNLDAAARAGVAHGAGGFLLTEWGDTGHHQQWPLVQHALAHGADAAWRGEGVTYDARAGALQVLREDPALGPWLEALGDADLPLRRTALGLSQRGKTGVLRNQTALFADLHNAAVHECVDVGAPAAWEAAAGAIDDARRTLPAICDDLARAELAHTLDVGALAAERAVRRREGAGRIAPKAAARLGEAARAVMAEHERLWGLRSRPGGLAASVAHYGKVAAGLAAKG